MQGFVARSARSSLERSDDDNEDVPKTPKKPVQHSIGSNDAARSCEIYVRCLLRKNTEHINFKLSYTFTPTARTARAQATSRSLPSRFTYSQMRLILSPASAMITARFNM